MQNPAQPSPASQVPPPFCGVPGAELAAMAQAGWNQMEGGGAAQPAPAAHQSCLPPGGQPPGGALTEQPSISLSAQAELELELSLRGSLLVQQQRRIVQLEDELQRAWAEIDRLRTKIAAVERERQRTEDDSQKQARESAPGGRAFPRRALTLPCRAPSARSRDTGRQTSTGCSWRRCSASAGRTSSRSRSTWARGPRRKCARTRKSSSSASRRSRQARTRPPAARASRREIWTAPTRRGSVLACAGLMQPAKNGRADIPLGLPAPSDGGGSSDAGPGQMQALQEASYMAQLQDEDGDAGVGGGGGGASFVDGLGAMAAVAKEVEATPAEAAATAGLVGDANGGEAKAAPAADAQPVAAEEPAVAAAAE